MASGTSSEIKIILCTIAYRDKLLDHVLGVAADLSFDGVEIWGREPHISEQFDENRVQAVQRMVQQQRLEIPVLGSYLRFGSTKPHSEGTVGLQDTLHTARYLGTPLVRVWASDVSSEDATEAVWERTAQQLQEACDQASKLEITFAVQMHANSLADTAPSARRLVELVDRDNLRVNYQVVPDLEPLTPLERLQAVMPYVVYVHAQNYASLSGDGADRLVPLGDGAVDYRSLIGQLRRASYRGCIAVEFSWNEGEGKREALAADLSFLKSLVNQ